MIANFPQVTSYLSDVVAYEASTRSHFISLYRSDVIVHPLPLFGDVSSARLLTVGVNPSATEFIGRNWPTEISAANLAARLTQYFEYDPVPPHDWFNGWREALMALGASYEAGA